MHRILQRYFLYNFIGPFVGANLFFIAFLLTFQLFRIMELVVQKNVEILTILELVGHICITFIPMATPLAGFFAIIFAMGKMSEDAELVAMKSLGFSKIQIFLPFLITAVFMGAVLLKVNQNIIPYSQKVFKTQVLKLSSKSLLSEIKPNQFFSDIPNMVLFAEEVKNDGKDFKKVFMSFEDKEMEQVITATSGKLIVEEEKGATPKIFFRLKDGVVLKTKKNLSYNKPSRIQKINFDEYFFPITSISGGAVKVSKDSTLMSEQLKLKIKKLKKKMASASGQKKEGLRFSIAKATLELLNRYNSPIQFFLFLIVGFSIGQKNMRSQKQSGNSKSFVFVLVYFLFFFFCISQAKKLVISPEMAIFFPTIVGLSYGVNLFRKLDWNS